MKNIFTHRVVYFLLLGAKTKQPQMKKLLLFIFLLGIFQHSVAQDDCQEIVQTISSTSTPPTFEVDANTGNTLIYYDLCMGDSLTLIANASFPENETSYTQTIESTEFTWFVNETETTTGLEYTQTYNESGGFIISLIAEDANGCATLIPFEVFVRVSIEPTISLSASPSSICPDVQATIGTSAQSSDINVNINYQTGDWESGICEDEFSDPLYLPDGSGETYSTDITLGCFGEEQTLTDVNDILSIDVNMEHSYSGDLDIYITAPNGVQVQLFAQAGGGTWFGEATDGDATETNPGVGYDYGWSMNPTYNGTMAEGITGGNTVTDPSGGFGNILAPDIYLPLQSLDALIGTPLNGVWTITIVDNLLIDNGWIFSWGLSINADIIPSYWNYENFIVGEFWQDHPTITSTDGSSITIFPTNPGPQTYTYEIVDNFGCSYTEDLNINVTTHVHATANTTNDICGSNSGEINLSISGGTPNYSVEWNGGSLTGQNIFNVSPGTYNYQITDAIGCIFEGTESIETEDIVLEFSPSTSPDICDAGVGEITINHLNGYAPYSYLWNIDNPNSATASNLSEDTYIVSVTDNYGCEGFISVELDNEDVVLEFDYTSEADHCEQGIGNATVIPLNGVWPYAYTWEDDFPDNATIYNLTDGSYDVFVTDQYGCEGETSVEVENIPEPTAYFESTFDTVVHTSGLVGFINLSYSEPTTTIVASNWSFGEGSFSTEFQPQNDFHEVGNYIVELTVTDSEGCTNSYYSEIVSKHDYLFWPPNAFSPNGDQQNDLYKPVIQNFIKESYELYIYDRWGKLAFHTANYDEGWNGVRQDNGIEAEQGTYTFLVRFNTTKNIIEEKTGSLILFR